MAAGDRCPPDRSSFERALISSAPVVDAIPRWSAARRMRSRALVDTLAPGVKARDTAERETPARLARPLR